MKPETIPESDENQAASGFDGYTSIFQNTGYKVAHFNRTRWIKGDLDAEVWMPELLALELMSRAMLDMLVQHSEIADELRDKFRSDFLLEDADEWV